MSNIIATMKAVTSIIINDKKEILIVSRKDDHNSFGLVGGKVDEQELPYHSIIREIKEETGLDVEYVINLFTSDDSHGYNTTTYLCRCSGKLQTEENHVLRWIPLSDISIITEGIFGDYNTKLFNFLKDVIDLDNEIYISKDITN